MRDYPHPEDLGLDPQADRTEDLRPGNNDGPSAGTPRPSESTIQQETEKGRSMTTVNPHPVDSATRPCCGGIGGHSHECPNHWLVSDMRRRINNILDIYPATGWTLDEADQVHKLLSKFVRERQADAARTAQW